MITTKKEYDDIISSYNQFMSWYRKKFLKEFKKGLHQLNKSMDAFVRHYYKEIMKHTNQAVVLSLEKRSDDILKSLKKLKTRRVLSTLNKIMKSSNELLATFTFWVEKFEEFLAKIQHEFGQLDPEVAKSINELRHINSSARYNGKSIGELFLEYLHETPLKNDFDTSPIGKLILARDYLTHKKNISKQTLKSLKKYSVEVDWNPNITARNQHGTFNAKFHFHVYIHHMYKIKFIEEVFTDQLVKEIKNNYLYDYHLSESQAHEKRAKITAIVKYFRDDVNEFTQLMLNYLIFILKLAYLKNPNKLIRSNYTDIYC